MNKLAKFIVSHKILIVIVFAVAVAGAVIGLFFVKQNSDIQSYLSEDSMTAQGRDALYEYFDIKGEMSMAIMADNNEAVREFVDGIKDRSIIKNIMWAGNFDEMKEVIDNSPVLGEILGDNFVKVTDKYLKTTSSGKKVYIISVYFNVDSTNKLALEFVEETESVLGEKTQSGEIQEYYLGGMAVNSRDMVQSSIGEIPKYLIIAVVLLLIILAFTTKSWLEPFIFIVTLGISILLNMGTNVIFESVSTITYSASTILQLALAMDYTIFLMHCYYDERKRNPLLKSEQCMERAIPKTLKSISASALTTAGGFLALLVMDFGIGIDLGLVLAKGVLLSLITVIFLQPVFVLAVSKPLEKTKHKYFTPAVTLSTKTSVKGRIPIVILAVLLIVPTFIGQLNVPLSYMTMTKEAKEKTETQLIIEQTSNQIIVVTPGNIRGGNYRKHYEFIEMVNQIDGIENGFSLYSMVPEEYYPAIGYVAGDLLSQLEGQLFSNGYTLHIFEITTGVENEATYENLDKLMECADKCFGKGNAYITGLAQAASDLSRVTPGDFVKVSCISALLIFLILLATFRSFKLSALLLLVIELGIWINLSVVTLINIPINFMSYLIISSVQLGATVDYAILAASKFKEVKGEGVRDTKKALIEGFKRATPSILVSATVLTSVCVAVYFVSSNVIISEITLLIAAGAVMSTFLVLFLLPGAMMMSEQLHKIRIDRKLTKAGVALDSGGSFDGMTHMIDSPKNNDNNNDVEIKNDESD